MRILVYPHDLAMGGSQINAIELAAAIRDHGHEVIVYGRRDTLVDRIAAAGMEFIESPRPRRRPTPAVVAHLRDLIHELQIDVVHGYEWPPTLEATLATRGTDAVTVSTVLSMAVAPFIPRYVPLSVGTEQILEAERRIGRSRTTLLEPPIDTLANSPETPLPLDGFRQRWGIDPETFTVVVVSRLAREMKSEGIFAAMEAVRRLHPGRPVQLVVVGGGEAAAEVAETARRINGELGARAVIVTGELLDPRPAYAVADVALGMGSSALRAMAFGNPLVVQGINGFWEPLTESTLDTFLWQGWYGEGDGAAGGASALADRLQHLMDHPDLRRTMGELSLSTARSRFSLTTAADRQMDLYERSLREHRDRSSIRRHPAEDVRAVTGFLGYTVRDLTDRLLRRSRDEDFNSRAVLVREREREPGPVRDFDGDGGRAASAQVAP